MGFEPGGPGGPFLAERIAESAELSTRLRAARALGVSLRRFCGWTPAEVTTHEHDSDGRVVRSVTRTEPEWDDGQRLWMLALDHYEASLCRKCGHALADTTDPAFVWLTGQPTECFSCSSLARAERRFAKQSEKDADPTPAEALIFTARKVPRPPRKTPQRRSG